MKKLMIACAITGIMLGGCKASTLAQFHSLGAHAHIRCYSGGKLIYEGDSTGNVSNEEKSDGWFWQDSTTGKLVESSGQCMFTY